MTPDPCTHYKWLFHLLNMSISLLIHKPLWNFWVFSQSCTSWPRLVWLFSLAASSKSQIYGYGHKPTVDLNPAGPLTHTNWTSVPANCSDKYTFFFFFSFFLITCREGRNPFIEQSSPFPIWLLSPPLGDLSSQKDPSWVQWEAFSIFPAEVVPLWENSSQTRTGKCERSQHTC